MVNLESCKKEVSEWFSTFGSDIKMTWGSEHEELEKTICSVAFKTLALLAALGCAIITIAFLANPITLGSTLWTLGGLAALGLIFHECAIVGKNYHEMSQQLITIDAHPPAKDLRLQNISPALKGTLIGKIPTDWFPSCLKERAE